MPIASPAEFQAKALPNGKIEFLLRQNGQTVLRAEFAAQEAGVLASALLSGAYHAFPQGAVSNVTQSGATNTLPVPIPTTGLALGATQIAGQNAIVLYCGDAIAGFLVNPRDVRTLGRSLLVASWKQTSNQSSFHLLRVLLSDFASDLNAWHRLSYGRLTTASRRAATRFATWITGRSLRLFQTVAIDHFGKERRKYAAAGTCIYCYSKVYSTRPGIRSTPLGDEHIIAEGLGGKLELPEASCQRCEHITGRIVEQDVLLTTLKSLRLHLGIRGKAKSSRPSTLPLQATIDGKEVTIDMPVEDYPVVFNMPIMGMPGILNRNAEGSPIVGFTALILQYNERKLRQEYGITSAATARWDTHMLYRMLGKIAHAFAVAELGHGNFTPALPELILAGNADKFSHIGGESQIGTASSALHELGLGYQRANGRNYVVATIRLFASKGGPTYHVVVGESRETALARLMKVFVKRLSRLVAWRRPRVVSTN